MRNLYTKMLFLLLKGWQWEVFAHGGEVKEK